MDGLSNLKGGGAGIVLERLGELVLERSLCFNFQANNNQAEYEAVIVSLKLAKEVKISHFLVCIDSKLIASQIKGDFQKKNALLLKYIQRALKLIKGFTKFEVSHIPWKEKAIADLLARLARTKDPGLNRTVIQETFEAPSIKMEEFVVLENALG